MVRLTKGQRNDLESIIYFIPDCMKSILITDNDIKMFFENSERGLHKDKISNRKMDGFNALIQGKSWRGIHIHELFELGVMDGTMPYVTILGKEAGDEPVPCSVMEFMAKEMFKGHDAELIKNIYNNCYETN